MRSDKSLIQAATNEEILIGRHLEFQSRPGLCAQTPETRMCKKENESKLEKE